MLRATIATLLGATVLLLVQAWFLGKAVAGVFLEGQDLADVRWLVAAMLALVGCRCALILAGDWLAQSAANRVKMRLRSDLTQHLLVLGPARSSHERTGELVNTAVQAVEDLDEYYAAYQPLRAMAVLAPAVVAMAVVAIDPASVIVLFLTGPVLVLLLILIGGRAREVTERRFQEMSWTSAHLLDMLQGLTTLKLFGRSREQAATVRSISRRNGETTMQVLRTAFETSFVLEICATLAVALVAVEVSLRLVHGSLPFDRALAVLIVTPEFFLPLRQLSARYHAGATGRAAAKRIFEVLDTPARVAPARVSAPVGGFRLDGDVRFEHVDYAYEPGRPALSDVSLTIPHGRTLALAGETGAGKTTVAHLLLRFMEPEAGRITVAGLDIAALDPGLWRSNVAWVPQRPYFFHGTVLDNLRRARPDATFAEVIESARAADAHEFVSRLPHGYDSQLGENAVRLSGGQQQRLAIARAFLKDARLLVLDEPTSYLDAESEARIGEALRRLAAGRTALLISHHRDLTHLADDVVVLRRGRVREAATTLPASAFQGNGMLVDEAGGVAL